MRMFQFKMILQIIYLQAMSFRENITKPEYVVWINDKGLRILHDIDFLYFLLHCSVSNGKSMVYIRG